MLQKNGKNAESTDGELHEHGETPNSMDGDIPKAQPNIMQQQIKICSWNIRCGFEKR